MKLVKVFQKTNLSKDPFSIFNVLMDQLDSNFRKIEDAFNGIQLILGTITNIRVGQATLVAGTVTVVEKKISTSALIFLCSKGAASGALRVSSVTDQTNFVITSSNAGDTGIVCYLIIDPL